MKPYTDRQNKMIINSFKKVFVHSDITFLNKLAYEFLMTCSGFNDHLSIHGFRAKFTPVVELAKAITDNPVRDDLHENIQSQCELTYKEIVVIAHDFLLKENGK